MDKVSRWEKEPVISLMRMMPRDGRTDDGGEITRHAKNDKVAQKSAYVRADSGCQVVVDMLPMMAPNTRRREKDSARRPEPKLIMENANFSAKSRNSPPSISSPRQLLHQEWPPPRSRRVQEPEPPAIRKRDQDADELSGIIP